MPANIYKLVFQDPDCKKFAPSKLEMGTYTTDTIKLVGSCIFYLVHPDTKHLQEVTFYVASNNGSVLLSHMTMLALGLIQPCTRLDYLPPRASLITSSLTTLVNIHVSRKESEVSTVSNWKGMVSKLITSKDQILAAYSDVFDGIRCFLGSPYHIQVDSSITPKQTPCWPVPVHLEQPFKQEIDKMYKLECWSLFTKQYLGSTVLFLWKGNISLEISNWEYVWILSIWVKLLCISNITLRPQKILPICLQKHA